MLLNHKKINNLLKYLVSAVVIFSFGFHFPRKLKAATLSGSSDYIPDDTPSETSIVHNVSFVIPLNGHNIVATDYIRVVLTNFSAVTAPTSGSGWTGVPTFGAIGNVAYVTGVTASAGSGIGISGITATNPADPADFDVTIQVANDINGTMVYDSAITTAQTMKETPTVSLTITVLSSSLEFFGFTSPGAFVTILLNGGVAGTTTGDGGGNFHKLISGLVPNQNYSISIYAQDAQLRQTQTVSFIAFTLPNTTVIYSNLVLPTTISLGRSVINQGGLLPIDGFAHPLSQITVYVAGAYSDVVQANSSGYWAYNFDSHANPLSTGSHQSYGKEVVHGGFQSIFTQALSFIVNSCNIADLNCDGFVNLTDFSILMYYWNQTNPVNFRVDINSDGIVNLTDFSIMLFHWTG